MSKFDYSKYNLIAANIADISSNHQNMMEKLVEQLRSENKAQTVLLIMTTSDDHVSGIAEGSMSEIMESICQAMAGDEHIRDIFVGSVLAFMKHDLAEKEPSAKS